MLMVIKIANALHPHIAHLGTFVRVFCKLVFNLCLGIALWLFL
jgi:hypothetical protein